MPVTGVGRCTVVPTLSLAAPVLFKVSWPAIVSVLPNTTAPVTPKVVAKATAPLAVSVVNAPVLGVVLPMGGGEANAEKSKGMEMLSTV